MKKITHLILGFTLASTSLFSQDFLPERFRDYKLKGELSHHYLRLNDSTGIIARSYDIDRNLWADIWELYYVQNPSKDSIVSEYPGVYLFDFNDDGSFEEDELIMEKSSPDGLNGNELYIDPEDFLIKSKKQVDI